MRLLHVIPSVSSQRGGPSVALRQMAEGVARRGVAVHVATTDDDGPGHLDQPLGVPVEQAGVTYWYFRRQTRPYTFSLPLTRWLARHMADYDLAHVHALFSYSTLPAALCAAQAGVPYIVRPLGTLNQWGIQHRRPRLKQLSLRLVERPLLARAALLHYTSEQEQVEAQALGICQPSVILPLGIELPLPATLPPATRFLGRYPALAGRVVLLFLSRLDAKKGLDLLLPAFAALQRHLPNTALVVAGSGDARLLAQLQAQAHELQIHQSVLWTGFLAGEDKLAALAAADLFVLPSYSENFGIAAVEAMAAGLPVVLSDQVAIHREVLRAGAGLVTPCEQPPLTTALLALASDAALRQRLGQAGRALAEAQFSLDGMSRNLLAMYERVLAG